jgi:hypothetical protein
MKLWGSDVIKVGDNISRGICEVPLGIFGCFWIIQLFGHNNKHLTISSILNGDIILVLMEQELTK